MASFIRPIKRVIQAGLRRTGYQIVRHKPAAAPPSAPPRPPEPPIGHEVCLRRLALRGYQPESIMDIGASSGWWTKMALQSWPTAQYFLVEPLKEHAGELAELHAAKPQVDYVIAAAGSEPGELAIGVQPDLDGSSLMYPGTEQRLVPVITVDGLVESGQALAPQVIKLDVQGYELQVLEGATQALRTCDLVIQEMQFFRFAPAMRLMHEAMGWMAENGFRPYEIMDMLRRPLDGAMGQCDIMFAREGHWLLSRDSWD